MEYESLEKIYYKNSSSHKEIYQARFNAPTTKHFDFQIKQVGRSKEYPAFLCYTEEIVLLIEKIYTQQEKFLSIIPKVPNLLLNQFELLSIVEEVKATSDIEGIHSTRRELTEILEGNKTSPHFSSIIKKYSSLTGNEKIYFKTCEDLRKFYDEFAHKEVVLDDEKNELDGKLFRKNSVDVTSGTGKILHRGLYSEEKIIESMTKALNILNDEKIPSLIRIAVFHYFFEYIHPFYDGNGRTARFIASYFLTEHLNYLAALRLSFVIKRNRKKYYELFRQTDSEFNCGDLTPFVIGFLEIIEETFTDIEINLNREIINLEKFREKLPSKDKLNFKICDLMLQSSLFLGTGLTMQDLMKLTGKSRNTIKSRLEKFSDKIIKKGKQKIFYKLNFLAL